MRVLGLLNPGSPAYIGLVFVYSLAVETQGVVQSRSKKVFCVLKIFSRVRVSHPVSEVLLSLY